jgi:hypothetical protein
METVLAASPQVTKVLSSENEQSPFETTTLLSAETSER